MFENGFKDMHSRHMFDNHSEVQKTKLSCFHPLSRGRQDALRAPTSRPPGDAIFAIFDAAPCSVGALSVMDVVVNAERLDILSDGQLRKILDSKWDKYAKATFRKRFWCVPRHSDLFHDDDVARSDSC